MTLTLSLALTLAQVKAGRGGECFSPQAYESAVGYWASAIEAELARRAEAEAQATYDPNLNPRISEAAPAEPAAEHTGEHAGDGADAVVARAVRFAAAEARDGAGGAPPPSSEAGGGGAGDASSSKPPLSPEGSKTLSSEGSKTQLLEASMSSMTSNSSKPMSRFGLLTLTPSQPQLQP